ncbi:Phosphatidylinositol/phosphatidylcholine transfer protein SFH7 [Ceratobasidium theobromae]|uniref:Phosphatidylinositol/phosphatidylcholine transfer protein SFH7 n=1 Tax=Ceratobasidium theobromae TaxID=1582974 RepID=A0A5N5QLD6_9AGAM|nr:Phosphatidylinositol/phosphatidylcholine transfer protein SFH7 [Ceratobasidium theobromae]
MVEILGLDEKQSKAVDELKEILQASGEYSPGKEGAKPSHSDATLIRFLRARRYSPTNAAQHFGNVEKWRAQHDVDNLYRTDFDMQEFEEMKTFYPRWTGRRDKHGFPLYVYQLSNLTPDVLKKLGSTAQERRYQRIIALYEYMLSFAFATCAALPPPESNPGSSAAPHITQATTIIDMQHTTLKQLFHFRNHLQEASTLATANYPETLGMIFVVGAPGWWSTVWGWVKGWFDEQTRAKVHILPNPLPEKSSLHEHIPASSLPKQYGGQLAWEYVNNPSFDEAEIELLRRAGMTSHEQFVPGPIALRQKDSGEFVLERYGKSKGSNGVSNST